MLIIKINFPMIFSNSIQIPLFDLYPTNRYSETQNSLNLNLLERKIRTQIRIIKAKNCNKIQGNFTKKSNYKNYSTRRKGHIHNVIHRIPNKNRCYFSLCISQKGVLVLIVLRQI